LRGIAALTESEISLRGPQEVIEVPSDGPRIVLSRVLGDWRGHPLRVLRLEYLAAEINRVVDTDWRQARVFFAFGLLLIVGVWLAIQTWVLRPLMRIRDSLASDNPQIVTELSGEKSELGRVAQLVRSSFEQRDALQREVRERAIAQAARERSEAALRANLEERSKLGRDLHDGVIQSLYAAGMGLTGIRALLRPDQGEAATRLEQSRAALNETIHDVRNFLIGLEPEALKLQTFSQAVTALLEMMNGIRPFHSRLDIDEELASRLTLAQRVHALQIAREAVSNALRHGEASRVSVALRGRSGQAEFEIADDGRGFDPAAAATSGKGLLNFAQRARELGADLTVDSEPGQGTRVKLLFSLSRL
jgi:signal transduction histidine kinase